MRKILVVLLTIALSTSVVLAASSKSITVSPNSVKISVNDAQINEDNFLYNGTTYVPLRAVSEKLGADVQWNQQDKTASITTKADKGPYITELSNADAYAKMTHEYFVIKSLNTRTQNMLGDYSLGVVVELQPYLELQDEILANRTRLLNDKNSYLSCTSENVMGFYEHIVDNYDLLAKYYDQLFAARKSLSKAPDLLSWNLSSQSGDIEYNEGLCFDNYQKHYSFYVSK